MPQPSTVAVVSLSQSPNLPGPHSDPESGPGSRWAELDEGKQCSPPQLPGKLNKLWSKEGSRNPAYLDLEILLGGEVFHISQPLSALRSLRLTWRCRTQPGTWLLVPSPPSRPKGSLPATHKVSTESTRNVAMSQTEISQELANKLIPMPNC